MLGQQQYLFRQRAGRPRPEGQSPSKLGTILRATKEKQNKKTEKKNYATLSYSACEFMHELNKTQARSQGGAMGAYMVRVVEYLIITVSPQERLSPPTVEHSLPAPTPLGASIFAPSVLTHAPHTRNSGYWPVKAIKLTTG